MFSEHCILCLSRRVVDSRTTESDSNRSEPLQPILWKDSTQKNDSFLLSYEYTAMACTVTSVSAGTTEKWLAVTTKHQERLKIKFFYCYFFHYCNGIIQRQYTLQNPYCNKRKTKLPTLISRACSLDSSCG